jgi:hypothetical protein
VQAVYPGLSQQADESEAVQQMSSKLCRSRESYNLLRRADQVTRHPLVKGEFRLLLLKLL